MQRFGTILMVVAVTGGLVACGGAEKNAVPPPVPDTFIVEGSFRGSDPFDWINLESRELPEDAVLAGAEYAVALNRYGVAVELTEEAIRELHLRGEMSDPPPWRAGKGREFLLVHLDEPEGRKWPAGGRFPTAAVLVDGQARQLSETALLPNRIIVASVPAGADATLSVTDGGQTQSISIRTGKLVGPSPKPVAPRPSSPPSDAPVASGKAELQDYVVIPGHGPGLGWDALALVEIKVQLRRYDKDSGAAPNGSLWANVEVKVFAQPGNITYRIDLPRSLTIRTAAGQVLSIAAGTTLRMPNYYVAPGAAPNPTLTVPDTWSGVFQVPEKTRKLSVTYRTRGTATDVKGKKVTFERRDVRNSGTITLK